MIEYAGVGVAMQNAEEPVKAVADYVTAADNDHDGVAEIFARSGALRSTASAFLCNVYKLLCKTLCLLSITKSGRVVYTNTVNVWWGECAHPALPRPECQIKRRKCVMNPIVEKVYQIGIIPVIAFNSVDEALPLCKALADGGLPAAEVTFRTACAEECIRKIHEEMPEMLLAQALS